MGVKVDPATAVRHYCRQKGYPEPVGEYQFARCLGRKWRWDLCWPDLPGGAAPLALEFQGGVWLKGGGGHTRGRAYTDDCEKYSTAAVLGWRVLLATTGQVTDGSVFGWLDAVLGRTGG